MKPVTPHPQEQPELNARMSRRRMASTMRRLSVVAIAGVAALMAVSPAIASAPDEPFSLEVSSHGQSVNASLGSFCDAYAEAPYCSDSAYPLETHGRLPIHPGGRIALRPDASLGAPALRVRVSIVRYERGDRQYTSEPREARPTDTSGRVWVIQMPHRLRGARILSIDVAYPDGSDANFEAAFTPHPASAHDVSRSCEHVAFTPNSDDMAAGIRTTGVSCTFARDFIRDFDAAGTLRYRGYTCTARSVDPPDGLAHTRFRCTRGSQVISWKRY